MLCRNDIDRVGVRPGCNLTMWSGDDYTGQVGSWTESDRWGARLGIYSELCYDTQVAGTGGGSELCQPS